MDQERASRGPGGDAVEANGVQHVGPVPERDPEVGKEAPDTLEGHHALDAPCCSGHWGATSWHITAEKGWRGVTGRANANELSEDWAPA